MILLIIYLYSICDLIKILISSRYTIFISYFLYIYYHAITTVRTSICVNIMCIKFIRK